MFRFAARLAADAQKPVPETQADLADALAANTAARATFDGFPPSARREYVEWIVEARRPGLRGSRKR